MAEVPNAAEQAAALEDQKKVRQEAEKKPADVIDLRERRDEIEQRKLDDDIVNKLGEAQDLQSKLLEEIKRKEEEGKNTDELKAKLDDANSDLQALEAKYDERDLDSKLQAGEGDKGGLNKKDIESGEDILT